MRERISEQWYEQWSEQVSQCECEFVACCVHIHRQTRLSPTIRPVFAQTHACNVHTCASAMAKMSALHEVQMPAGKCLGTEGRYGAG